MNYWENLLQVKSIRKDELDPVKSVSKQEARTTFNTVAKNI